MVYICESLCPAALAFNVTLFSWEFFTTLYFEWDVIRGRRPYLWSIWVCGLHWGLSLPNPQPSYLQQVYSIARISTLMAVILNMVEFDTTSRINCQVSPVFHVWPVTLSDQLCFQALGYF